MRQKEALNILKTGRNVFLTGAAGSGKTYVLHHYLDYLRKHNVRVGVTASTGIAATHLNGQTIHSWSGMGIKSSLSKSDLESLKKKANLKKNVCATNILVIDEISMLNASQLDMVDLICRAFKHSGKPFGGMQVILSGDLFQLPPVNRSGEDARFAYFADSWREMRLSVCYLDEQHRQSQDDQLLTVLNTIRSGSAGEETKIILRTCYKRALQEAPTKLRTHNAAVHTINENELSAIDTDEHVFEMQSYGPRRLIEPLAKSMLAEERLILKEGALVMFVKNNFDQGYVNGTLGTVTGFNDEGYPEVKTHSGDTITATPEQWTIEEGGEVKARILQIPLRLAWAITVHKSQGMSLDAAEIDLSRAFEKGMGYVALSRVRTLEGLCLMGLNQTALEVDENICQFDQELQTASDLEVAELEKKTTAQLKSEQAAFLKSVMPSSAELKKRARTLAERKKATDQHGNKISTLAQTAALLSSGMSIEAIAKERGVTFGTIINHLERLRVEDDTITIDHLRPEKAQFEKIKKAFDEVGDVKLTPVKKLLGEEYSYDDIKLVRLFLE